MDSVSVIVPEDYTVGWICALPLELAAGTMMFDERHDARLLRNHACDENSYKLGRIGAHNVVMTCLLDGGTGKSSAAVAAHHMKLTFPTIRIRLMVGVGGGVPDTGELGRKDIRLGDVVVSHPERDHPGVIQYDFGKTIQNGRFERSGSLNKPSRIVRNAVATLRAEYLLAACDRHDLVPTCRRVADQRRAEQRGADRLLAEQILKTATSAGFPRPEEHTDVVYQSTYDHPLGNENCSNCDPRRIVWRPPRHFKGPVVHYGLIASADQVMRWGRKRDELWNEMKMDCFEMEAAGLMEDGSFLIIRGICDYADSHKNKIWQPYAATTASAYAKELLNAIHKIDKTGDPELLYSPTLRDHIYGANMTIRDFEHRWRLITDRTRTAQETQSSRLNNHPLISKIKTNDTEATVSPIARESDD